MPENTLAGPELPNFIALLEKKFHNSPWAPYLALWENIIFSLIIAAIIIIFTCLASRKAKLIPGRLQNIVEVFVNGVDNIVCGILGSKGRSYVPFIGTLFIYIFFMNLFGLIPFMKSATTSWSITLALALCVFVYVQYTAFKELGLLGYIDHLMERPRGFIAFTVVIPLMMFFLSIISELVKPITLSLRLRSNIWGDDMLLALLSGFGIAGIPLLFFNTLLTIIASTVQAVVFCLLTTVYFAFVMRQEEG